MWYIRALLLGSFFGAMVSVVSGPEENIFKFMIVESSCVIALCVFALVTSYYESKKFNSVYMFFGILIFIMVFGVFVLIYSLSNSPMSIFRLIAVEDRTIWLAANGLLLTVLAGLTGGSLGIRVKQKES